VTGIPYTVSGKVAELAVRATIHGEHVGNIDALANPGVLDQYHDHPELRVWASLQSHITVRVDKCSAAQSTSNSGGGVRSGDRRSTQAD